MSMKFYNRLQIGLSIAGVVFILLGCVIGGLTSSSDSMKLKYTSSSNNISVLTSRDSDSSDEATDDSTNTLKASEDESQLTSE